MSVPPAQLQDAVHELRGRDGAVLVGVEGLEEEAGGVRLERSARWNRNGIEAGLSTAE